MPLSSLSQEAKVVFNLLFPRGIFLVAGDLLNFDVSFSQEVHHVLGRLVCRDVDDDDERRRGHHPHEIGPGIQLGGEPGKVTALRKCAL